MSQTVVFTSLIVSAVAVAVANDVEQTNIFDVDVGSDNPLSRFHIDFEEEAGTESPSSTVNTARTGAGSGNNVDVSCTDGSETLIAHEDVRWNIQFLNVEYLENASIDKACARSSTDEMGMTCNFDFGLFPNNLDEVCEKYGGVYEEREHSIQCHDPTTKEQLYYQIDRFPNYFPAACHHDEIDSMVEHQIDTVRRALEDDSGMICYADYDILRHAGEYDGMSSGDTRTLSMMSAIAIALALYWI